jgi:phosphoglycerate dehydrogenase-like enzyme
VNKLVAVLPVMAKKDLESRLPEWVEPRWFSNKAGALAAVAGAQIAWLDMASKPDMAEAVMAASQIKWLNSLYAGVDGIPLQVLQQRGVTFTNGAGINAITIAEYVIMGMLTIAKGFRETVHAQDRREWLAKPPGRQELFGSKALIIGYGAIGKAVQERLVGFKVDTTVVRRSLSSLSGQSNQPAALKVLGPHQWQERLGEFDWVILAVPATAETQEMFGAAQFAAMKPSAVLLNVARGSVVDQTAMVQALRNKTIAAAFIDVTTPEPLPTDHPLWALDNAHVTMHLSGRSQSLMVPRSCERFLANLERFRRGEALEYQVDLELGY